jgi:hypothetical protein
MILTVKILICGTALPLPGNLGEISSLILAVRQPQERKKRKLICMEKQRLLDAYQAATQRYSAAVTELLTKVDVLSRQQYDALYGTSEDLLQDVAAARVRLQTHVHQHRC